MWLKVDYPRRMSFLTSFNYSKYNLRIGIRIPAFNIVNTAFTDITAFKSNISVDASADTTVFLTAAGACCFFRFCYVIHGDTSSFLLHNDR